MTEVLLEDFESISEWVTVGAGSTFITARTGQGVRTTAGAASDGIAYNVATGDQSNVFIVGFAYRMNNASLHPILELRSDAGATLHNQLSTGAAAAGDFRFTRGGTTLVTSAAGIIVVNTWYYIEVRATLGDSPNGAVIVRVNGTEILNTASLDTKGGGTKTVYDQIRLVRPSGAGTINSDYDDLYLRTGSAETFRGDVPITPPSGAAVQVWNGTAFVDASVNVWNGTAFVDATAVKVWNGTSFVDAT